MEIHIERNELLAGLYLAQGIVDRRLVAPILGNVLITTEGDEIRMMATDQEIALRRRLEGEIVSPGAITASAPVTINSGRADSHSNRPLNILFATQHAPETTHPTENRAQIRLEL